MTTATPSIPPGEVLRHWSDFATAVAQPVDSGLIKATFLLHNARGAKAILQRLHPVFAPEVNLDMDAVTRHLAAKGLVTPRLLPTDAGTLWVQADDGVWRAQTHVAGRTHHFVDGPETAREAGRLAGKFHAAVADLEHPYRSRRTHVHDTPAHLRTLETALETHRRHRLYAPTAVLAEPLLKAADTLVDLSALPLRHVHGDLKISNLMFDHAGHGLCLIDLDTLTRMPWPLEMGDALRSWCNPRREDQLPAKLDPELFAAAVAGYRAGAGDLIGPDEWQALVPGLARICLELASRFLADALNERYFGWEPKNYPGRGEHNLARGAAMWALYADVVGKRSELERLAGN